jgi:hypothetical protein
LKYDQFLSNYYFPSHWEAIGVITPEDKDLNFAVENQRGISKFTLHDKVNRKGYDVKTKKVKI